MNKRILRVNVMTYHEDVGVAEDYLCVELTPILRELVEEARDMLRSSFFDKMSKPDDSAAWVIVDPDTREWGISGSRLVVCEDGSFRWEAYFKHSGIDITSDYVPFAAFDWDDEDLDTRQDIYDPEVFLDEGDEIIRDPFEEVTT
jgi:hypothetical protein